MRHDGVPREVRLAERQFVAAEMTPADRYLKVPERAVNALMPPIQLQR